MYIQNFHDPYFPHHFSRQNHSQLISDLQKAINGEFSAVTCYGQLAQMAPNEEIRKKILEIREDERRHLQAFSTFYTNLTGRQPSPQMSEKCANTYVEGLVASFKDEQETVDFYLDIADYAEDISIKETFKRAAADEQNHAVWFSFFLQTAELSFPSRQGEDEFGAKGALNTPSPTLNQMLTFALQDEFLAQSRYNNILLNFGYIRTFARIQEAELRHISALLPLFERYQVPVPEDVSRKFVSTPDSLKSAFSQGVRGEIENISMYDRFLKQNLPNDVRMVFTQLRDASLNHLAAFERGLARI